MIRKLVFVAGLLAALLAVAIGARAQLAVAPLTNPHVQFFSAAGAPLAGGQICTFAAGTSTPIATYKDAAGTSSNGVCAALDSGGFATIFLQRVAYKLVAYNAGSVQQWSVDNLRALAVLGQPFASGLVAARPTSCTASTDFFVQTDTPYTLWQCNSAGNGWNAASIPGLGTLGTQLTMNPAATAAFWQSKPVFDVRDYASLQAAVTAALAAGGGKVLIPPGTYNLSTEIAVDTTLAPLLLEGSGNATVLNLTGTNNKGVHVTGRVGFTDFGFAMRSLRIVDSTASGSQALVHLDGVAHFYIENVQTFGTNKAQLCWLLSGSQQGEVSGGSAESCLISRELTYAQQFGVPGTYVHSNGVEWHGMTFVGSAGTTAHVLIPIDPLSAYSVDSGESHGNHYTGGAVTFDVGAGTGAISFTSEHVEPLAGHSSAYVRAGQVNFSDCNQPLGNGETGGTAKALHVYGGLVSVTDCGVNGDILIDAGSGKFSGDTFYAGTVTDTPGRSIFDSTNTWIGGTAQRVRRIVSDTDISADFSSLDIEFNSGAFYLSTISHGAAGAKDLNFRAGGVITFQPNSGGAGVAWTMDTSLNFRTVTDGLGNVGDPTHRPSAVYVKDGIVNAGTMTVGGGTTILKHLSATASLDFAAWAGGDCQDLTITVTGAADGDTVNIGVPLALSSTAGVQFTGFVSAGNTVTVRGCKITAGASANPAASTVRADVWQH